MLGRRARKPGAFGGLFQQSAQRCCKQGAVFRRNKDAGFGWNGIGYRARRATDDGQTVAEGLVKVNRFNALGTAEVVRVA